MRDALQLYWEGKFQIGNNLKPRDKDKTTFHIEKLLHGHLKEVSLPFKFPMFSLVDFFPNLSC